jgi:hypothetical protein
VWLAAHLPKGTGGSLYAPQQSHVELWTQMLRDLEVLAGALVSIGSDIILQGPRRSHATETLKSRATTPGHCG